MPRLGVNIDHIATLREARKGANPDPAEALPILLECGVDQVTCHLREDRRHIQDKDLAKIIAFHKLPVNLEMAPSEEMFKLACQYKTSTCTLVPEKREEITTEGGLNCKLNFDVLKEGIPRLQSLGIQVSLFIDPDLEQIELTKTLKAQAIEFHTGAYCEAFGTKQEKFEFDRLAKACRDAKNLGIKVFAGHGLDILNLPFLRKIPEIEEYNIGHSIISRALFIGLKEAIREIQNILKD